MCNKSRSRLLVQLVLILYYLSIFYYTLYGVSKSMTEYFCIQKRAGDADYSNTISEMFSLNIDPHYPYCKDPMLVAFNESFKIFCPSVNSDADRVIYENPVNIGPVYELDYVLDKNYFKFSCEIQNKNLRFSDLDYWDIDNYHIMNRQGYFFSEGQSKNRYMTGSNIDYNRFLCKLQKSPETCDMKKETQDWFSIFYLVLLITFTVAFWLNLTSWKRMIFRRFFSLFHIETDVGDLLQFCNPISKKSVKFCEGDDFYFLSKDDEPIDLTSKLDMFYNDNILYSVKDDQVLIMKNNGSVNKILLDQSSADVLMSYFQLISTNSNFCIVNKEVTHYQSMEEVIRKISLGFKICKGSVTKAEWALDVSEIDLDYLKQFSNLKEDLLKFLLEHNNRFFSVTKIKSLISCLNSKMSYKNRPEDVKNSQWKWYCSDFCRIIKEKENMTLKSEVKWTPSPALMSMDNVPEIKMVSLPSYNLEDIALHKRSVNKNIVKEREDTLTHVLSNRKNVFINYSLSEDLLGHEITTDGKFRDSYDVYKEGIENGNIVKTVLGEAQRRYELVKNTLTGYKEALMTVSKPRKTVIDMKAKDELAKMIRNFNAPPRAPIYPRVEQCKMRFGSIENMKNEYENMKPKYVHSESMSKRIVSLENLKTVVELDMKNRFEMLSCLEIIEEGDKKLTDLNKKVEIVIVKKEGLINHIKSEMSNIKRKTNKKKKKKRGNPSGNGKKMSHGGKSENDAKTFKSKSHKPEPTNNLTLFCDSLDRHLDMAIQYNNCGEFIKNDKETQRFRTIMHMRKSIVRYIKTVSGDNPTNNGEKKKKNKRGYQSSQKDSKLNEVYQMEKMYSLIRNIEFDLEVYKKMEKEDKNEFLDRMRKKNVDASLYIMLTEIIEFLKNFDYTDFWKR